MSDTIALPGAQIVGPRQPIAPHVADGFLVMSRKLRLYSVKLPYEYRYDAEWFPTLGEADEYHQELANGEHEGWEPVAILACKGGVPLGAAPMGE